MNACASGKQKRKCRSRLSSPAPALTPHLTAFQAFSSDSHGDKFPIISTWMRLAIFQTLSLGEGDWRTWFAVNELDALGPIDGLSDAFTSTAQVWRTLRAGLSINLP
jgi:hypothetical protein